jgi:glucosylglycerate phosphorylase
MAEEAHGEYLGSLLVELYGDATGRAALRRLLPLIESYRGRVPARPVAGLTASDAILIAYGDHVTEPGQPPLRTLADFCTRYCGRHLAGSVSTLHILPFYPASSDDGFAVIDYHAVDPALGGWEDIAGLGQRFGLMFDAVINHVSSQSPWFQSFLLDDAAYRDFFITVPPDTTEADLAMVVRPRTLPLLTAFEGSAGPKTVWTTFSADQIDLNYANPAVLLAIVDTLLFYAEQGARLLRLDAIAYLWKEPGTPCINRPQVHTILRLLRGVLDAVAPHVLLITETNVPHLENISYFGDGYHEAQLVYNFALPPLTLHALQSGSAAKLSAWAGTLRLPSPRATFFNFLASHDGIGLNPARGILSEAEITGLEERTLELGGLVSYKSTPAGRSAYELNINYRDALRDPGAQSSPERDLERFMTAQAIMLALPGVPGIYFTSLFGLPGWPEGVTITGRNRTINRQKFALADLEARIASSPALDRYRCLLAARAASPAFDPYGIMEVVDTGNEAVFALWRAAPEGDPGVLCLHNVSGDFQRISIGAKWLSRPRNGPRRDLITGRTACGEWPEITLSPYETLWCTT